MDCTGSLLTRKHGIHLSPIDINAIRFGSAGLSLAAVAVAAQAVARRRHAAVPEWVMIPRLGKKDSKANGGTMTASSWAKVCAGVVFCTCLCPTLNNFALFRIPLATAATLSATGPLFALPLTWLVRGEKISAQAVAGATTAVTGVALLAFSTPPAHIT